MIYVSPHNVRNKSNIAHTEFVKYFISFVAICDAIDEQFYHELLTLALIICTGNEVSLFI